MHYFHRVPPRLMGDMLYPLNQLKQRYPRVYEEAVSKYKNRKDVLRRYVPTLDCEWGDVVFLTAIRPSKIHTALVQSGFDKAQPRASYVFDSNELLRSQMAIMRYDEFGDPVFSGMETLRMDVLEVSEETRSYYRECHAKKRRPLIYHLTPQILYKGWLHIPRNRLVTQA